MRDSIELIDRRKLLDEDEYKYYADMCMGTWRDYYDNPHKKENE